MNKQYYLSLIFISAFFSGCATFKAQNCSENAGYEKGMNDAKMGRLMATGQFATMCSSEDADKAQKAYRQGYEAGKNSQGPATMNVSLQNGKLGLTGAYSCQLIYQNQTFASQASTETQARNNVMRKCRSQIPACLGQETNIGCSKN